MAKTRTLPTGEGPRGFTLLELLVVLTILALTIALATPVLYRVLPGLEVRSGARIVAAAFREARGLAIAANAESVVTIDLDARALKVNDGPWVALSPRVGISLVTATREADDSGTGGIRFYPDGTSTGGGVRLSLDEWRYHVFVDWITGRVAIGD